MRRDGRGAASPPLPCRPGPESGMNWLSESCIESGLLQRSLGTAFATSVQRCAISTEGEPASTHFAATAASGRHAAQAGFICIAVRCSLCPSPPTSPADAQNLTVSLKKEKEAKPSGEWRNVNVMTREKIWGCGSEEGFIVYFWRYTHSAAY